MIGAISPPSGGLPEASDVLNVLAAGTAVPAPEASSVLWMLSGFFALAADQPAEVFEISLIICANGQKAVGAAGVPVQKRDAYAGNTVVSGTWIDSDPEGSGGVLDSPVYEAFSIPK